MQEPTTVAPVYSHLEEATAVRTTRWNDLSGDYGAGIGHWSGQPYVDSLKGDGGLTWWGDVSIATRVAVANSMVEPNAPIWGERLRRIVGFGSDWLGGSIQYGRMVLVPALCYEEGLLAWPTKVEIPYGTGPGGSQYLSYASDVALADPAEIPTRALTCAREDGTWDLRARVVQVDEFSLDPDDDEQLLAETSYGDLATLDTNTVFGGLHGWGDGMQALRLTRLATDRYLVVYLVDPLDGGSKAVTEWDGSNGDVSGHAVVRGITTSGTSITVGPAVSVASGVLTVDLARVDDERAVVSYGSANQNIFDGSQSNMESIPFGAFGWQSATPATVEVSWTFGGTIARTGSYGLGLRAVEAVTEMRANPVFTSPNSPAPRVVAGSSYTVEGWVRAASASRTVNIGIQWVGPTGTVLSEWLSGNFSDASGSWTRIYGTGVAPAGTAYAHPFVKVTGSIGADERHWFDDFSLLRSGAVGGHRVVSFNGTTIDIGPEYTQAALYAHFTTIDPGFGIAAYGTDPANPAAPLQADIFLDRVSIDGLTLTATHSGEAIGQYGNEMDGFGIYGFPDGRFVVLSAIGEIATYERPGEYGGPDLSGHPILIQAPVTLLRASNAGFSTIDRVYEGVLWNDWQSTTSFSDDVFVASADGFHVLIQVDGIAKPHELAGFGGVGDSWYVVVDYEYPWFGDSWWDSQPHAVGTATKWGDQRHLAKAIHVDGAGVVDRIGDAFPFGWRSQAEDFVGDLDNFAVGIAGVGSDSFVMAYKAVNDYDDPSAAVVFEGRYTNDPRHGPWVQLCEIAGGGTITALGSPVAIPAHDWGRGTANVFTHRFDLPVAVQAGDGRVLLCYTLGPTPGYEETELWARVVQVSGTTVSFGAPVLLSDRVGVSDLHSASPVYVATDKCVVGTNRLEPGAAANSGFWRVHLISLSLNGNVVSVEDVAGPEQGYVWGDWAESPHYIAALGDGQFAVASLNNDSLPVPPYTEGGSPPRTPTTTLTGALSYTTLLALGQVADDGSISLTLGALSREALGRPEGYWASDFFACTSVGAPDTLGLITNNVMPEDLVYAYPGLYTSFSAWTLGEEGFEYVPGTFKVLTPSQWGSFIVTSNQRTSAALMGMYRDPAGQGEIYGRDANGAFGFGFLAHLSIIGGGRGAVNLGTRRIGLRDKRPGSSNA